MRRLLDDATSRSVVNADEAAKINGSIKPSIDQLALAAATELDGTTEDVSVIRASLMQMTDRLVASGRLTEEQEEPFCTMTKGLLDGYKLAREQEAANAAHAAEIEAANVAKIAALPVQLSQALGMISTQQKVLDEKFEAFKGLNAKAFEIGKELFQLSSQKVDITIGGKVESLTITEASMRYTKALREAAKVKGSPEKADAAVKALESSNAPLIPFLGKLADINAKLSPVTAERAALLKEIEGLSADVAKKKAVFSLFYASVKKHLSNPSEIESQKKAIEAKDHAHYKELQERQGASLADQLKGRSAIRVAGNLRDNFMRMFVEAGETEPSAPRLSA